MPILGARTDRLKTTNGRNIIIVFPLANEMGMRIDEHEHKSGEGAGGIFRCLAVGACATRALLTETMANKPSPSDLSECWNI